MIVRVIQCFFAAGRLPPSLARRSLRGSKQGALQAHMAQPEVRLAEGGIDPLQLGLVRGGGQPLPQALLAKMESAFNADFSDVRVHIGPQAGRLGALAFTTGKDLYFAPGQYQPHSMQGQQLIGHELAHVVQQRQGRVRPSASGISVVVDQALEAEADRHGMRAAQHIQPKRFNEHQHISRQTGNEQQHMRAGNSSLSIQRKTAISFYPADDKAETMQIVSVAHQRELHTSTQRMLAAYLSGYDTIPAFICNHHVPYSFIRSEVERILTNKPNLGAAVQWINGLKLPGSETFDWNNWGFNLQVSQFTLGAMPGQTIQPTKTVGPTKFYAENALNTAVNDLIWNLANDPRNLFYWPASTGDGGGTQLDHPSKSNQAPMDIKHINARLKAYRLTLKGLGLNVAV